MRKAPKANSKQLRKGAQRLMLGFDTETTGLIENVTVKDDKLPEVIDFYGCLFDIDTGKIVDEVDLLIRPTIAKKLPEETIEITGIDDAMLKGKKQFKDVADSIAALIQKAPIVAAHNAAYDKEVLDIEFSRVGGGIDWPRIICTVEQTMHFKGHRLSLTALHEHLFGEAFQDAHRARTDVTAMVRCIVELVKRGELL